MQFINAKTVDPFPRIQSQQAQTGQVAPTVAGATGPSANSIKFVNQDQQNPQSTTNGPSPKFKPTSASNSIFSSDWRSCP